ncbi:MAG TPA: beta-1,6-N-acetylglucosaminyltransferase [Allosphingosinicella sp.]|nr:beta-1,6-N-acetylglucosaminyltransferase [Allosphingosinicella sp.]
MIAYFILVHRYPEQFKRMFRAIYLPGNSYVVHVDKSSGVALEADVRAFLAPYQGVDMIASRKALWGGYSLVDAELRGMARLLDMNPDWTHFINLSGQDFPLKSQAYARDFLAANPGRQFIRFADQAQVRPDTMERVGHYALEAMGRMFRTRVGRPYLAGARPYIGTQWKAVTRAFCDFVCHDTQTERFKSFYRKSFIPDEGFFQSAMLNTRGHGEIVNDDLRMIDWVPDGHGELRPHVFTVADALRLKSSTALFARKFDALEDAQILDLLEAHIATPQPFFFRAEDESNAGAPKLDPSCRVGTTSLAELPFAPALHHSDR